MSAESWPTTHVELLTQLSGRALSAAQIAVEMARQTQQTFTRNQVIGKAHRMGLHLQGSSANRTASAKQERGRGDHGGGLVRRIRSKPTIMVNAQLVEPIMPTPEIASNPVTFIDLDMEMHCRWPIGEPQTPDFRYCGAPRALPGDLQLCYCWKHYRTAYVAYTRKSR
jgi:GcrA cell cycle regulator